jgi:hypothetical protein
MIYNVNRLNEEDLYGHEFDADEQEADTGAE